MQPRTTTRPGARIDDAVDLSWPNAARMHDHYLGTQQAADGIHSAIVRAAKPST